MLHLDCGDLGCNLAEVDLVELESAEALRIEDLSHLRLDFLLQHRVNVLAEVGPHRGQDGVHPFGPLL